MSGIASVHLISVTPDFANTPTESGIVNRFVNRILVLVTKEGNELKIRSFTRVSLLGISQSQQGEEKWNTPGTSMGLM